VVSAWSTAVVGSVVFVVEDVVVSGVVDIVAKSRIALGVKTEESAYNSRGKRSLKPRQRDSSMARDSDRGVGVK
jgi:hypothetical protein